jgi:hypothetical protein
MRLPHTDPHSSLFKSESDTEAGQKNFTRNQKLRRWKVSLSFEGVFCFYQIEILKYHLLYVFSEFLKFPLVLKVYGDLLEKKFSKIDSFFGNNPFVHLWLLYATSQT